MSRCSGYLSYKRLPTKRAELQCLTVYIDYLCTVNMWVHVGVLIANLTHVLHVNAADREPFRVSPFVSLGRMRVDMQAENCWEESYCLDRSHPTSFRVYIFLLLSGGVSV